MKLIENGEPIVVDSIDWIYSFQDSPKLEHGVTYLTEVKAELGTDGNIHVTHKVMGKKCDYICGDCGVNFISHKGMCSSCYVKQL